ncbi:MAG: hypothetical protein ACOCXP_00610 [Candidatus Dojkabacteria bacterium]
MKSIVNQFVKNYLRDNNLELLDTNEDKPWGGYYIFEWANTHDKKVLWVKPGEVLSLQFHGTVQHPGHREHWLGLSRYAVFLGTEPVHEKGMEEVIDLASRTPLLRKSAGESTDIPAGHLHALYNPYPEDIYVIEIRTSQVNEDSEAREKNITRIFDQARRDGLPKFPPGML